MVTYMDLQKKWSSADGPGGPLPSKIDGDSWFDRVFTMHFMTYGTYGFWFTLFTSFIAHGVRFYILLPH